MRKSENVIRAAAVLVLICGFWGIFYPEFTLTSDSYRKIVADRRTGSELSSRRKGFSEVSADYYEILNADEGEVVIRFSFLERRKSFD